MNLMRCGCVAALMTLTPPCFAQVDATGQADPAAQPDQSTYASDLRHHGRSPMVRLVREATARYRNVDNAIADGYQGGPCVSGPEYGAMGIHYVNEGLLGDGAVDAMRPEALVYEPGPKGHLRLVGVEYITLAEVWDSVNEGPPVVGGHQFNFVGAPNRSRLPAFYELHVWAWRKNPFGTFADWNPRVSCEAFDPPPVAE